MTMNLKPQASLQALTEDDLSQQRSISQEDRAHLLAFTTQQLSLYVRAIGGSHHFAELMDNIESWRTGYNEADDYYWCAPSTNEGFYIRGIGGGTAVFKWGTWEFRALSVGVKETV